jgi:hypothetical protein
MQLVKRKILLAAIFAVLFTHGAVQAQTAPQIGYLFPAGAQQGTSVEVLVGGKYMPGPCQVWIGGQGLTSKSKTTEGRLTLNVAADTTLGTRNLRIYSVQGGSSPRPFVIGALPETVENEAVAARSISFPSTINGRLNPKGDIDEYRLSLRAGQQIVCSVAASSLGSPGDVVLRLSDANGRTVATANDHRGPDPLLVYRCPSDGDYSLRIFNFDLSGGVDHVYRLTVTNGPFLDYAFPSGLQFGKKSNVTLYGWNLADGDTALYSATTSASLHDVQLPGCANPFQLPVAISPATIESEPNDSIETANKIVAPQVIHGRFNKPGDTDAYIFEAKKGDRLLLDVKSASLDFPADPVLKLVNDKGVTIREVDDVAPTRDPRYLLTVPADGIYHIVLSERAGRGGPRFIYQLHVVPPQPDFSLTIKASEFAIVPGEKLIVPVRVVRKDGFAGDLTITANGLPPGVTVEPQSHTAKSPAEVKLELSSPAQAQFASAAFRIVAQSSSEGNSIERTAAANVKLSTASTASTTDLWLAVGPKVPFELSVPATIQEAPRLSAFPFPISIMRSDSFSGPIRLVGVDPDKRGTVVPMSGLVAETEEAGTLPLVIQSMAIEGTTHRCRVMGVANITGPDGKLYPVFHVAKGSMMMGCQPNLLTLTVTPAVATWKAGQRIRLTVTIERRVAMGDVTVMLTPASKVEGIDAQQVTIPAGKTTATFLIDIASNAKIAPKVELELRAKSTRAGLPVNALAPLVLVAP